MSTSILDRISALADPTRSRILLLLDGRELMVGELCAVLQLPQSTVSPYPTCTALAATDGTAWKTVEPFACSKKQYPVK